MTMQLKDGVLSTGEKERGERARAEFSGTIWRRKDGQLYDFIPAMIGRSEFTYVGTVEEVFPQRKAIAAARQQRLRARRLNERSFAVALGESILSGATPTGVSDPTTDDSSRGIDAMGKADLIALAAGHGVKVDGRASLDAVRKQVAGIVAAANRMNVPPARGSLDDDDFKKLEDEARKNFEAARGEAAAQ